MSILVTGGAGYIGSHTVVDLVENGYDPVIVDNLCNSKPEAVKRVRELCGRDIPFYPYDLCDIEKVREVFAKEKFTAVIHFAGLKAVGESVQKPLDYFRNNLINTLNVLQVAGDEGKRRKEFRILVLRNCVRTARNRADKRELPPFGDKPVRQNQTYD